MSKSMILISSSWQQKRTFKMIPAQMDCPFNEVIFDPEAKVLAIVSKEKKATYHMLPKLDENGDPLKAKSTRSRENPNPFAQQRMAIETYYEYFIESKEEIVEFINRFGQNNLEFDFNQYLEEAFKEDSEKQLDSTLTVV